MPDWLTDLLVKLNFHRSSECVIAEVEFRCEADFTFVLKEAAVNSLQGKKLLCTTVSTKESKFIRSVALQLKLRPIRLTGW